MAKIVNFGVCLNNDDPLMAGRIRATFDTDFKSMSPGDYSDSILNTILSDTIEKAGQQGGDPKYTSTENIMWSEACATAAAGMLNVRRRPVCLCPLSTFLYKHYTYKK